MDSHIDLSYRLDEELWELYLDFKPETVEIEELSSFFILPFRLLVGEVELFWSKPLDEDEDWLPALPLIGTVLGLARATADVEKADQLVELLNHGTFSLRLQQDATTLELRTSMTGKTALIELAAWQEVVDELVNEVRELLRDRLPAMLKHVDMGPWLLTGTLPEL
jgi:hypothetical protein